jgi:hypothetical protein
VRVIDEFSLTSAAVKASATAKAMVPDEVEFVVVVVGCTLLLAMTD